MDKKRPRIKKKDKRGEDDGPNKEEKAVATYLRFNCPSKSTTLPGGDEVHYFSGAKAVDMLMESKWKTGKKKSQIIFSNRQSCVNYMQCLMEKGLFWRARKLVPKRKDRPAEGETAKDGKKKKQKESKESKESAAEATNNEESSKEQKNKEEKEEGKSPKKQKKQKDEDKEEKEEKEDEEKKDDSGEKKKKKKVKLDFHQEQIFKDATDAFFVWHFDPTPWTKFLLGLGIVLGSIVLCLFPLWPPWMRLGVYYVSVVAMGFVGFLIGLIIMRSVVFGIVWAASFGNHHLWILPNLTEDCGFFESFKPYYSHKYCGGDSTETEEEKKKKEKDSSSEEDNKNVEENGDAPKTDTDREGESEENESQLEDEQESINEESSAPGTPDARGKDVRRRKAKRRDDGAPTNGFEIVNGPEEAE